MIPHLSLWQKSKDESGIRRVVEAYFKHLPSYGIELVARNATSYDLVAAHAGMGGGGADVAMCHGLYWTADYQAAAWEFKSNADVVKTIRHAKQVTVPSPWVAETFRRDMHLSPTVVPHGIDWHEWQHSLPNDGYVLWNKNRTADVCSTDALGYLCKAFPQELFLSTYSPKSASPNLKETGVVPHAEMQRMIQQAGIYLSTTKETFGIGVLEAMASGTPVLAVAHGGNLDLIRHGVNGYLAQPDNLEDLVQGLSYCLEHRQVLGENGRELAKQWTWQAACQKVAEVYRLALQEQQATVAIIIPTWNYADRVEQAVTSALQQNYKLVTNVIVVDDGSTDNTAEVVSGFNDKRLRYIKQGNAGVAVARNNGISATDAKYIVCLDADDSLEPSFVSSLVPALEGNRSLGIVYSGLQVVQADGQRSPSNWPGQCNFDKQVKGQNQVPTCCMFRREAWERLGGYRQRFAPLGMGSEDAEFWLRIGSSGWGIKQVTSKPLFLYSMAGRTTSDPDYQEADWTVHPYCEDGGHPFASIAKPQFYSHPVRQYDQPTVSVIIPVGPGHEQHVRDALDSLEWQTFRKWEVIVIDDTEEGQVETLHKRAYPFVRWIRTEGKLGAGYARNRGAEAARGDFVLFLDADDWLNPHALQEMLIAWNQEHAIIYTDYVGKAVVSDELREQLKQANRLLQYNSKTQEAVIAYHSAEYDCNTAQSQPKRTNDPNMPFYHWCLVTCLIPRVWHEEIGGFDESLSTWEDIEYHWHMARAGKCYVRLPKQLVIYNFHTGHRRHRSLQDAKSVVQYITRKFEGIETMPCSGCGSKQRAPVNRGIADQVFVQGRSARSVAMERAQDDRFVLCRFTLPQRGKRPVVGGVTQTRYGYHQQGDRFLVNKLDVWIDGDPTQQKVGRYFEPIQQERRIMVEAPKTQQQQAPAPQPIAQAPAPVQSTGEQQARRQLEELPAPEPIASNEIDLQALPGIGATTAERLKEMGVNSAQELLALGVEGLSEVKGITSTKAQIILDVLGKMLETEAVAD